MYGRNLSPGQRSRLDQKESPQASTFGDSALGSDEYQSRKSSSVESRFARIAQRLDTNTSPSIDNEDPDYLHEGRVSVPLVAVQPNDESFTATPGERSQGDGALSREVSLPEEIPLPSQSSDEVRRLSSGLQQLATWKAFILLHDHLVSDRVAYREHRKQIRILQDELMRKFRASHHSLLQVHGQGNLDDSLTSGLDDLRISMQEIESAVEANDTLENQLIAQEWRIANLTPDVLDDDGEGERILDVLNENDIEVRGEDTPSESPSDSPEVQISTLDDRAQDITRKINLINSLEDLSLQLTEDRECGISGDFAFVRLQHADLDARQQNVRREIALARHELDQLRSPPPTPMLSLPPADAVRPPQQVHMPPHGAHTAFHEWTPVYLDDMPHVLAQEDSG